MLWLLIPLAGLIYYLRKVGEGSSSDAFVEPSAPGLTPIQPDFLFGNTLAGDFVENPTGRELATPLSNSIPDRDAALLEMASLGQIAEPVWTTVSYTKDGHTIQFAVATDALMIGNSDPIRLNATHPTAQKLADLFGAMLPTTRMADAAYQAGHQIAPQPGSSDSHMSDTSRMIEHSDRVSRARALTGAADGELIGDNGKHWVNTEQLLKPDGSMANMRDGNGNSVPGTIAAANFGWHTSPAMTNSISPGGAPVIQSIGLRHNDGHTDYSQVVQLYGTTLSIDGNPMKIEDIMQDPDLAYLVSDEVLKGTPARVWRYPAVPLPNA